MKRSTLAWIVVIIIILIIVVIIIAYSNSDNYPATTVVTQPTATQPVATPTTPATPVATGTVVLGTSSSAALGTFLVAPNGMALYQYSKDTPGASNCTGACATAWPPYTVSSATGLVGSDGLTGAISTITRADGTMQVTYNGMPLYYFESDSKAGVPTGQNVNGFTVVKP